MRLSSWGSTFWLTFGCLTGTSAVAGCDGALSKYMTAKHAAMVNAACEQMPFDVGIKYIDKNFLAFSTKDIQQPRSTFIRHGGFLTRHGTALPTIEIAQSEAAKMERRTGCRVQDLVHSTSGPTLYSLVCSQGD